MKTWAIVAIQMMSFSNMIATQSSSTSHVKRWFSWLSHQSVQILSGRFMGWTWTLATLCCKWGKMNHLIKFLEKSSPKHWNDFFPGVDCSAPPEMPSAGSWQWAGNVSYGSDSFSIPECQHPFLTGALRHTPAVLTVSLWTALEAFIPRRCQSASGTRLGPHRSWTRARHKISSLWLSKAISSITFIIMISIMIMINMIRRQHATIFLSHQRKPAWSTHHLRLQSRHLRSDISIK